MAYRMTDTGKWGDSWFRKLSAHGKIVFNYLCDQCDYCGHYELLLDDMARLIGISEQDCKSSLLEIGDRVEWSEDKKSILLINFIRHQRNLPLNSQNKAHVGIVKKWEEMSEKYPKVSLDKVKGLRRGLEGGSKGANRGLEGAKKGDRSPLSIGNSNRTGMEGGVGETNPTMEEVSQYFILQGYRRDVGEKAFKYYDSAQWKDRDGKPVVNWQQKMVSVWFTEDAKQTVPQIDKVKAKAAADDFHNSRLGPADRVHYPKDDDHVDE